jgi:signal transduction histidine kinase
LSLRREAGQAVLRVRDDGIGFDKDEATRVFELFVRGERAKRRVATGLGIGLHVAKQIVEAHGGTISAMSDGPGRGTTFEIRLPLAESR